MLFVAAVFAVTVAGAQDKGKIARPHKSPEERADSCASRLQRSLDLDANQKTKVRDLALTRAQKMDELREKYKGQDSARQTWREERMLAHESFNDGMKLTLTTEQFAKWEEQKKARAAKRSKHHGKGHHKHQGGKSDSTGGKQGHGKCGDGKPENK